MKIFNLVLLFSATFLCSCASSTYNVQVNSIARSDSSQKNTYILATGNENTTITDLQFIEYANYVEKGLSRKGLEKASTPEDAKVIIYLSYGVGEPKSYTNNYSVPTWGQTGYSGSTTTGYVNSYSNNYASYSANTTYTPQYGITGYVPVSETVTLYPRWFTLSAYDLDIFRKTQKLEQVWKTTVVSSGENSDLRRAMPPLIVASWEYWAESSGEVKNVSISEYNFEVMKLKDPTKLKRDVAETN